MLKIALLPGGFKPPHAGHYNMAKWLSANTGADTTIIFVGPKERDGITQAMSLKLWELYTQNDSGLEVRPAGVSPVRDVYDFIEQEASKGSTVYLGMGEKDVSDSRFKNIPKFAEPKGITFETKLVPPQAGGVSGTEMRGYIKMNDKALFQYSLPEHLSDEQKNEAWDIVTGLEEDLYNPEDKVLDYMRGSEWKAGMPDGPKPDKTSPVIKYQRGGMYNAASGQGGAGTMYEADKKGKILHAYDFDDTIAQVKANIKVFITSPSGDYNKEILIPAANFPEESKELEARLGSLKIKYDFSEFEKQIGDAIVNSKVLNKLKDSLSRPDVKTTILTARSIGHPVTRYLKSIGLDAYVVPLGLQVDGKVTGQDKADWIEKHINKGYKTVYFIDDSEENRTAVSGLKDKYSDVNLTVEDPASVSEINEGPQFGVLYHFTEFLLDVLDDDRLRGPVSLTRSLDSFVPQWLGTEPYFVLDKDKLRTKYKITPFKDTSDDPDYEPISQHDEMEEVIKNDITDLARYTIKVVLPYSDENWENALKEKNIPYEVKALDEMMGMMNKQEKAKHAKNMKRLSKDMSNMKGNNYGGGGHKVPDYVKGTLTRKLYEKTETSVFSKDWWKEQLTEVLTETKANTHLTHLEELILTQGQDGFNQAKNFLYELIKNLKGEDNTIKNVSVKWDGAPAIFTGINPDNGQFFVGTKSVFNVNPKINYTPKDIDENHGHAAGLAKKLKLALQYLPAVGIKGILQGDFMFDNDDVQTEDIDGTPHYTFKPNTIRYAIEANSELGKQIIAARIGIIFHTTYNDLSGGGASFGADISGLSKSPSVWFDDAYFKDDTGVLLSDQEEKFILEKIKEADSVNVDYTDLPLKALNTYLNSEIRQGEFVSDPTKSFENFKNWYQLAVNKSIEKVKRPESKERKKQAGEDKIREFESQKENIINIFRVSKILSEAKAIFIAKYDKAVATKHFIDNGDGTLRVTKAEGFVAVDHTENGIKLVDRMEFSRNNFNAGKPGAKK